MKAAQRINRGFWRIALVGAGASAAGVVVAVVLVAMALLSTTVTVYVPGKQRYIILPIDPTASQVQSALESDGLDDRARRALTGSTLPMELRVELMMTETAKQRDRDLRNPLWLAAGFLCLGLLWVGLLQLVSWLVRGFLE